MKPNKPVNIKTFRHLYPFRSNWLDINAFKYHYLDEGQGDPVVMIHGNPTWSFYFRNLVQGLSSRFRTIVPDHIGCGLSDKPDIRQYDYRLKSRVDDLEALLSHLRISTGLSLIVHDWGGMIGMAYALRHRQQIRRLVVMNTAAFLPPQGKTLPMRLRMVRNLNLLSIVIVQGLNLFARGALWMAAHKRLAPDVRSGLTAPYNCWKNRIATLRFVQDIPVSKHDPSWDLVLSVDRNLHQLAHLPVLICWGEHDFVFDGDYLAEWCRRFPAADVHRFPDAGHYVLEDKPDEIVGLVKAFLLKT